MQIGVMAQSGLYIGDAHEMKGVLTTANGFADPRAKAVGALCEESQDCNINRSPSQEATLVSRPIQVLNDSGHAKQRQCRPELAMSGRGCPLKQGATRQYLSGGNNS